jgi:hypothetical protein
VGRIAFAGESPEDPALPWGGEQTIGASDCAELVKTSALVVTVAIERLRAASHRDAPAPALADTRPIAPAPSEVPTRNPRPSRRPPAVAAPTRHRLSVSSSAAAVVAADLTPGATIGTAIGVQVRAGELSIGLEGAILAPSNAASSRGGEVSVSLQTLALTACWHQGLGRRAALEAHACPLIAPLFLRGVGQSLAQTRVGTVQSVGVGGRLGAGVDVLTPLRFEMDVEAVAPITRQGFSVDEETVWIQPMVGFAALASMVVRFR